MVAVVSTSSNDRLMDDHLDGDLEINDASTSSVTLGHRFITKRRTIIFASILSFLILAIASTLAGVFVARHRAITTFRENLTQFLDEKFTLLEPEERSDYVTELTDLFKKGHITNDHVAEVEVLMEFGEFNKVYSRQHADAEERRTRFLAFRENYNDVIDQTGEELYEKAINKFSDMTEKEFESRFPPIPTNVFKDIQPVDTVELFGDEHIEKIKTAKGSQDYENVYLDGEDLDWRRCSGVSPVKDQGNCGSCWAFASVGAVESLYLIQNGETLDLSEQELVNCDRLSYGCNGGFPFTALTYIKTNGISHEKDVPYHAVDEECGTYKDDKVFIDRFFANTGISILHKSLVVSPTIVHIAASRALLSYKGGIYNGPCSEMLNHAVLLVGEGYDEATGKRYWIVKNSWGQDWGENGYFRLERTDKGTDKCDILMAGFTPVLKKSSDYEP